MKELQDKKTTFDDLATAIKPWSLWFDNCRFTINWLWSFQDEKYYKKKTKEVIGWEHKAAIPYNLKDLEEFYLVVKEHPKAKIHTDEDEGTITARTWKTVRLTKAELKERAEEYEKWKEWKKENEGKVIRWNRVDWNTNPPLVEGETPESPRIVPETVFKK